MATLIETPEPTHYVYRVDRAKSKASHLKYYTANKVRINEKRQAKYNELDAETKAERCRVSQRNRTARLAAAAKLKGPAEERVQCECKQFLYPSNMQKHLLTKTHLRKML